MKSKNSLCFAKKLQPDCRMQTEKFNIMKKGNGKSMERENEGSRKGQKSS